LAEHLFYRLCLNETFDGSIDHRVEACSSESGTTEYPTRLKTATVMRELWHNPVCLAAASSCLIAALCSPIVSSILSSRPMMYLGRVSYGVYLLHMPVLLLLYRVTALSRWPALFLLGHCFCR
jgi:hypothetical protein